MLRRILFAFAFLLFTDASVKAQTVYQQQSTTTVRIDPAAVDCASAAGARWTGWIAVSQWRNVVFDITFVDANSSAASLDVRCETTTNSGSAADSEKDLPVIVSTASTGTSVIVPAGTWSYRSTTGAAPGSFESTLYIENIPAPFIECLFTCGAGGAAADTIGVNSRTITP